MNKMFFFSNLYMHTKFKENRLENADLPIALSSNPRSKLETFPKMDKAVTQKGNYRFS